MENHHFEVSGLLPEINKTENMQFINNLNRFNLIVDESDRTNREQQDH